MRPRAENLPKVHASHEISSGNNADDCRLVSAKSPRARQQRQVVPPYRRRSSHSLL